MFDNIFAILVLLFWILAFCVTILFALFQFYYNACKYKIGYMPTASAKFDKTFVKIINKYCKDTSQYSFVELGSGMANVSSFAYKMFDFKEIIAVEIDFIMMVAAKLFNFFDEAKIKFVRSNIFKYDLPKDSVVYCFLGHQILNRLHETGKLDGHLLISTSFKMKKEIEPTEVIEIGGFYQKIVIYDFRKSETLTKPDSEQSLQS